MKLKAHPIGLINDKQSVLAEEDAREKYRVLHSTPGNIKLRSDILPCSSRAVAQICILSLGNGRNYS